MPKLSAMTCIGLLLVATPFAGATANTITFDPNPRVVGLGGPDFTVDLVGTGFASSTDGGSVSISFDPAVLQVVSVVVSPTWNFYGAPGTVDNLLGTVTGIEFATLGAPPPSFTVGTITFAAISAGNSLLGVEEYLAGIVGGFAVAGSPQAVNFVDGLVQVQAAVPVPAALWFILSGVGLLAGLRRQEARLT